MLVTPDLRGFGWSDAPAGDYDKETLAADVVALLDALELDRVKLVGHDWGAFAGFLACLHAPKRIERYVACNIIHPWYRPPKPSPSLFARSSYQFVLATPVVGEAPAQVAGLHPHGADARAHPESRWADCEREVFADRFASPATRGRPRPCTGRSAPRAARAGPRAVRRRRLTVPTLLVTGSNDPVITPDLRERLRARRPPDDGGARGLGHFSTEEAPAALLERILGHFAAGDEERRG